MRTSNVLEKLIPSTWVLEWDDGGHEAYKHLLLSDLDSLKLLLAVLEHTYPYKYQESSRERKGNAFDLLSSSVLKVSKNHSFKNFILSA